MNEFELESPIFLSTYLCNEIIQFFWMKHFELRFQVASTEEASGLL